MSSVIVAECMSESDPRAEAALLVTAREQHSIQGLVLLDWLHLAFWQC